MDEDERDVWSDENIDQRTREIWAFFDGETRIASCQCADYFQCLSGTVHEVRTKPHSLKLESDRTKDLKDFIRHSSLQ